MHIKQVFVILAIISLSNAIFAQVDTKIEKKLKKLFKKGKYEKCYDKARSLNKKHPGSFVPEYYISKINLKKYSTDGISENRRYSYLGNAVKYSSKLPEKYSGWKSTVKDSLAIYLYSNHDSAKTSNRCKNALKLYTRTYKDTLTIYSFYFPGEKPNTKKRQIVFYSKSDSLREELVKFAAKLEGITYNYTGEKPETGFDCSGFTKYVYGHIGVELPHNAQLQSNLKGNNKTLAEAKVGDLVFFGSKTETGHYTQHAGIIYSIDIDEMKVIHCVSGGVSIDGNESSWERYWKEKVLFVKTLPELKLN
jgi:cell wall-associated NlpC family hydrolase